MRIRFLLTAFRIARRDLAASRRRFLAPIAIMACGITSLGGTHAAIAIFREATSTNLREWIASDMAVMTGEPLDPAQSALVADLEREGIDTTMTIEAVAQASSERVPTPQLVMARAADPRKYPYYGRVRLEPAIDLAHALTDHAVAVSEELLLRLEATVGSRIDVNGAALTISAVIRSVPDQLALAPTPLPKILLSREAARQAGLERWHGIHYERVLLRLPPRHDLPVLRRRMEEAFPGRRLLDYQRPDPQVVLLADRAGVFLGVIGLLALLVGTFSVSLALWSHLDRSLDSIAIAKVLGGSSGHLLAIYGCEALLLAAAGSFAGMLCGVGLSWALVSVFPDLFSVQVDWRWNWSGPLRGAAMGMLAGLTVVGPLFAKVRGVRPNVLLRRNFASGGGPVRRHFLTGPAMVSLVALFLLIASVQGSGRASLAVFAGLGSVAGLIALLAGSALRALSLARPHVSQSALPVRHGMRHLLQPGSHASAAIGAMSAGIALLLTVQIMANSAMDDLIENVPPTAARLLLMNVQPDQLTGVTSLLSSTRGVTRPPAIMPFFVASASAVEGTPIENLPGSRKTSLERRWLAASVGPDSGVVTLIEGKWWSKSDSEPQVALPRPIARAMRARLGSRIEFLAGGRKFTARLSGLFSSGGLDRLRCCFFFNPAVRVPGNVIYHGLAEVSAERSAAIRETIYRNFPTITTIDGAAGLQLFERWVDSILWLVRMAAALTMMSAAILAGAVIAANLETRAAEIAVWRVLGARTRHLIWTHVAEFTAMGAIAGLIGAVLATLAAAPAWAWFADRDLRWPPAWTPVIAVAAGVALANIAGWLAVWRALVRKPLEVIREM